MEEIIQIDLNNKYDLLNKYNERKTCDTIIEYIIKQATTIKKNKKIKIIISRRFYIDKDVSSLIKEGLKEEFRRSIHERDTNNIKQFFFLILGIIFIFLSTLIKDKALWKELLLITGWVPIWETIELELFSDVYGRRKRRIIKKLLNSEIIERSNKIEED